MSGRLTGEQSDDDEVNRRYSEDERTNTLHAPNIRRWIHTKTEWTEEPVFNLCSTRGGITFLLASINCITMLSRCSLAILLVPMGEQLHWGYREKGWIFGSFFGVNLCPAPFFRAFVLIWALVTAGLSGAAVPECEYHSGLWVEKLDGLLSPRSSGLGVPHTNRA